MCSCMLLTKHCHVALCAENIISTLPIEIDCNEEHYMLWHPLCWRCITQFKMCLQCLTWCQLKVFLVENDEKQQQQMAISSSAQTSRAVWPHTINKICVSFCNSIRSPLSSVLSSWIPGVCRQGVNRMRRITQVTGKLTGAEDKLAQTAEAVHGFFFLATRDSSATVSTRDVQWVHIWLISL